jgi:hypothetical protein
MKTHPISKDRNRFEDNGLYRISPGSFARLHTAALRDFVRVRTAPGQTRNRPLKWLCLLPLEPDVAAGVTSGGIRRATAGMVVALKRPHHALHMPAPFNSAIKGASCRARSITALMTCTERGGASGEQHRARRGRKRQRPRNWRAIQSLSQTSQELNNAKLKRKIASNPLRVSALSRYASVIAPWPTTGGTWRRT